MYLYLLEEIKADRKLYVAIGTLIYKNFFQQDVIQLIIKKHQLPMIIVDTEKEEIVQWIN
uniref:element excision factor XisH family protein n=1 Tax=Planktothricoides raciborskii TaxID=132608 RepID=UPI0028BE9AF0